MEIKFENGSIIEPMFTFGSSKSSGVRATAIIRHEVYEMSKHLFDYEEIPKEEVISILLNKGMVHAIIDGDKPKITKGIEDTKYIFRLLLPIKYDDNRDSYFVLVSSTTGIEAVDDLYDYHEMLNFRKQYSYLEWQ